MEWQPIETAKKDGRKLLLLTHDFGAIEGWWDTSVKNFWKTKRGSASFVSDNEMGDWVTYWYLNTEDAKNNERRLFCGATPIAWMPLPEPPCE